MEWSFRLVILLAAILAVLAADHHLLDTWLTDTLAGLASALAGLV